MIQEINILPNNIIIKEEKKGLFKSKENTLKIDIDSIDKIEKIKQNNEIIGIVFWNENDVIYAIGIKNYEKDLEELLNKILVNINEDKVEIVETEL